MLIHQSVQQYSVDFETVYKRKNFSTPKNYLDFINNYTKFLTKKRKQLSNAVVRLEGGLTTLAKGQEDTQTLSEDLTEQNAIVADKKAIVTELIRDIEEKTKTVEIKTKAAEEKKAQLAIAAVEIVKEEAIAAKALEAAAPALAAAQAALQEVQQKDLVEIKALANPAESIKIVCTICFIYQKRTESQRDDSWASVKQHLLSDPRMLVNLQGYEIHKCKPDQANRAKKLIDRLSKDSKGLVGEDLEKYVRVKSLAAGGLFKWCTATTNCYDVFRVVEPQKKKAEQLNKDMKKSQQELEETIQNVRELQEVLATLNKERDEKVADLNILEARSLEMSRKLEAASKLITGLGAEQVRWTSDMQNFKIDKVKLVGDCLTASAFLSYSGPFNFVLRQKMIFEHWKKDLEQKQIPNKEDFKLDAFLTDDVEKSRWASEGLPSDDLSIQNGILTNFASRWPLCIDPQMQAVSWIKEKEKKNGAFRILSFNQGDYIKVLENCIRYGSPVLFEAIDTELDPMIDPVLEKNIVREAGEEILYLGDSKVEYNHDFKMYLTTKIANPSYSPEVFGKTMIINFNVTLLGLRDQLLNYVVGYEKPELEKQRKELIMETSANQAELKELEDTLLSELSAETDVPLVDNVPLIEVLERAKSKSVTIAAALENAKITTADINTSRESYKSVAKRGAILFFALTGLSAISEMYEYSLSSYLTVFMNALETSKKDNVLSARLRFITEKLTQLVYEFTCMGIFESHKLMFSFQMTTMIMDGDDELNREEMDFFLKGNTSLDSVSPKPFNWMSTNGWKDAIRLQELGGSWASLLNNIQDNEPQWKRWYDMEAPEMAILPCRYSESLNKFQQLCLCRIFRPDRVWNAIKNFIMDRMNEFYVKSPPLVYEKIYAQSTEKTPIVFILSPGADPQGEIQRLVEQTGIGMNKFRFLALGQGMEGQAKSLVELGAIKGHWVMLQNCHLLTKWLKKLEAIIEGLQKPDKQFRLWLTTAPTDKFPLGILQKSIKVVTEPPDGLSANIKQNYTKLSDEMLEECPKKEFKSLVYVLSFFHATI